jgi:hypothetical protein
MRISSENLACTVLKYLGQLCKVGVGSIGETVVITSTKIIEPQKQLNHGDTENTEASRRSQHKIQPPKQLNDKENYENN